MLLCVVVAVFIVGWSGAEASEEACNAEGGSQKQCSSLQDAFSPSVYGNEIAWRSIQYQCTDIPSIGLGGYCKYENSICLDPDGSLVVIDEENAGKPLSFETAQGSAFYQGKFIAVQTRRQRGSKGLPFRAHLYGRFEDKSYLERSDIQWVGKDTLIAGFDSDSDNIFHFASQLMLAWHVQLRLVEQIKAEGNTSPFPHESTCSLFFNVVFNRTREALTPWQRGLMDIVLGKDECRTTMYAVKDENGVRSLKGRVNRPVCFESAFTLGMDNGLFSGSEDAEEFLRRTTNMFQLRSEAPFMFGKVVMIKRGKKGHLRGLTNFDEILQVVQEETNRPVEVVVLEELSFRQQVELMLQTSILIAPHGAGLTNAIFMPPGAAIIEMNGWGFSFELYHLVAVSSGHFYYRFVADPEDSEQNDYVHGDYASASIRGCMDSPCQVAAKDLEYYVKPEIFRRLIREVASVVYLEKVFPVGRNFENF